MDGFRLMMRRITRFFCLSLLLLGLPALAQDVTTRGEDAFSTDDGTLIVHVSVPRGQIIEEGQLSSDSSSESVILQADAEPLSEVQWFVLDASGEMLNAAPFVKDALQRFLSNPQGRIRYGVIVYDSRPRVLVEPTSDTAALIRELDNYSGTAEQVGCVGDALALLRSLGRSPDEARRVLLVAGPLTRQGTCNESAVQSVSAPIDAIIIADDVEGEYLDIAERSRGIIRRANLQTVSARFSEVKSQWLQPIYALRGRSNAPLSGSGSLRVLFTDGSSEQAFVRVSGILLTPTPSGPILQRPATATPPPTDVPPPTAIPTQTAIPSPTSALLPTVTLLPLQPASPTALEVAQAQASATPFSGVTPIFAPLPSDTPLPIGQPLNQPTSAAPRPARVTFTPPPSDTPQPPSPTELPSATPQPPSPTPTEEESTSGAAAAPTLVQEAAPPSATPQPPSPTAGEDTSSAATDPTEAPQVATDPTEAPQVATDPTEAPQVAVAPTEVQEADILNVLSATLTTTNPLILAGGGLAVLAVLIGLVALASLGRQQRNAQVRRVIAEADHTTLDPQMRDQTMIDPALMQRSGSDVGLDFYSGSGQRLSKDELRRQAQVNPPQDQPPRPAPRSAPRPPQDYSDEEDMVLTSVLDDSDFQSMQAKSGGEVLAWLRLDAKPPRDYELRASGLSIGRKADNDIVVTGDSAISGQHARLEVDADEGVTLIVLSKTNPVVISGVMLRENERRVLRSQDVIQLSPTTRLIFVARADGESASFDEELTLL